MVSEDLSFVVVEGYRMAYHRSGRGEPLLLVHGITTYSFIWRQVIPDLTKQYDVIAIDLMGCGDSDKPLNISYALAAHARYLKGFVEALGIQKFHFIGHDLGGGIGQIFAVRYSEMLYDLVLINSVAYDFWPVQPIIAMRTPIVRQLMMAAVDVGALRLIVKRGLYHKEKLTSELMDLFMKPLRTPEGRKAFLHFARCLDNRNLMEIEAELRTLELPVLIIRGDADVYLSEAIAERLQADLTGGELVKISSGGHFIQEDEPKRIAQLILKFIGSHHE